MPQLVGEGGVVVTQFGADVLSFNLATVAAERFAGNQLEQEQDQHVETDHGVHQSEAVKVMELYFWVGNNSKNVKRTRQRGG